jgi:enediyne biosynthesis protein E4
MLLARNTGQGFVDVSTTSGEVFQERRVGRGMAVGDIDNAGKLDVIVTTNDGEAHILHNETPLSTTGLLCSWWGTETTATLLGLR